MSITPHTTYLAVSEHHRHLREEAQHARQVRLARQANLPDDFKRSMRLEILWAIKQGELSIEEALSRLNRLEEVSG